MIQTNFIYILVIGIFSGFILFKSLRNFGIIVFLFLLVGGAYFYQTDILNYLIYVCLPLLLYMFLLSFFFKGDKNQSIDNPFRIELTTDRKRKIYLENINTGVFISAASGGGKTQSVIYQILKGLIKKNFCGLIYDVKDGELTEVAYPLICMSSS